MDESGLRAPAVAGAPPSRRCVRGTRAEAPSPVPRGPLRPPSPGSVLLSHVGPWHSGRVWRRKPASPTLVQLVETHALTLTEISIRVKALERGLEDLEDTLGGRLRSLAAKVSAQSRWSGETPPQGVTSDGGDGAAPDQRATFPGVSPEKAELLELLTRGGVPSQGIARGSR